MYVSFLLLLFRRDICADRNQPCETTGKQKNMFELKKKTI